ncbi:MAG: hypothetical protein M1832_000107 [Thelocarpon impressellum]|nr:MAG: hypothetical protein M1832_000107 [Thelocarpon impressellum]
MPTKLKPLLLPQLVEARRSEESKEAGLDPADPTMPAASRASSHAARASTASASGSDMPSPVTPTFSLRGLAHHDSPASSVDLAAQAFFSRSPPRTSPASIIPADALDAFPAAMRSLPDVKEEPSEEQPAWAGLEDGDVFDHSGRPTPYQCFCDEHRRASRRSSLDADLAGSCAAVTSPNSYDLAEGFTSDGDCPPSGPPRAKRRRGGGDSPLGGIAARLSSRFPSFTRRWKGRRAGGGGGGGGGTTPESLRGSPRSGADSSRASSMTRSVVEMRERYEAQMPATPDSILSEADEDGLGLFGVPVDAECADEDGDARDGDARSTQVTTPLLPPLMVPDKAGADAADEPPVRSPLQSPTVAAEAWDGFASAGSPEDAGSAPVAAPPSPPLSTRPSVSSMRRQAAAAAPPGHLVPSSEIPGIRLADPDDHWARRLGHANFDIHPEPYRPDGADFEACLQLRANWEQARCNYTKHLVRTGEHYGVTSTTYRLTEEKWAEIDSRWRRHHDRAMAQSGDEGGTGTAWRDDGGGTPTPGPSGVVEIPSLNDPRSEGKFPKLGDEVIVGPMVQIASQLHRKPTKKAALMKFLQDVKFPGITLGRSGATARPP